MNSKSMSSFNKLLIMPLSTLSFDYSERENFSSDAGLDLYIQEDVLCFANRVTFIGHKISCELISTEYDPFLKRTVEVAQSYFLVPRSSISKTPLIMANSIGIIDSEYRGEIIGAVYNTSNKDYIVKAGTRMFQIIMPTLSTFTVKVVDELSKTIRGDGGFGSTGGLNLEVK